MSSLLIRNCEIDGIGGLDVRVRDGVVAQTGAALLPDGEDVVDASGGALIPGLHDHHLHLFALAAALDSVDCSPAAVADAPAFGTALRSASRRGPVRGVGYFESVAGILDRHVLDALVPDVPVRVQHRSGSVWFLNSAALAEADLLDSTGRVVRGDDLLRRPGAQLPDLSRIGQMLASYGVTGVTDATPQLDAPSVQALHAAQDEGTLPQRMLLLGAPLEAKQAAGVPWKIVVDELVGLDPVALVDEIRAAHGARRPVAIHCTSRAETVLAVSALRDAGAERGDRLEHAGILPRDLDSELARAGVAVVTQPHFIAERGDDYLTNVEFDDHDLLYRCGSLIEAGVPVAAGTDAPYGGPDPWVAIAAAVYRQTSTGAVIGRSERLTARRALDLFLGRGLAPGGEPRQIAVGAPADLCLLDTPLETVVADRTAERVLATVIGGRIVHRRPDLSLKTWH